MLTVLIKDSGWDPEQEHAYTGAIYREAYQAVVTGKMTTISLYSTGSSKIRLDLDGAYG